MQQEPTRKDWRKKPTENTNAARDDDDVTRRILKFMKQMNAMEDDATLLSAAIAYHLLDEHGTPTIEGQRLASGLQDMETTIQNPF